MTPYHADIIDLRSSGRIIPRLARQRPFNVLFTCIGRRVSLLRSFRDAARRLRLSVGFYGTDATAASPALQSCDQGFLTSPAHDPRYLDELEAIVRTRRINLVIPTVDLDLSLLARVREDWLHRGCQVLVSSADVVQICQDKRRTVRLLEKLGFHAPLTVSPRRILEGRIHPPWPCVVKPWDGYASRANVMVRNRAELRFYARRIPHAVCQAFVQGREYTCDVYIDRCGEVRCVVPRQRVEVRSGEVSKARVAKDPVLMDDVARLVRALGAGPGVVTVQVIVTPGSERVFIEINPRFGGGVPLAIRAGADFPYWLLAEMAGRRPRIRFDGFTDGLLMLRYDDEIWVSP
jgi:carbamoyl-phosphate synthase large subunit